MAGIKGRSGSKVGASNNPYGRPAGALGKAIKEIIGDNVKSPGAVSVVDLRNKIAGYLASDWENFMVNLEKIDTTEALKIKKDLYKMVLPRPTDPKDSEANTILSTALARFFNIKAEDVEK